MQKKGALGAGKEQKMKLLTLNTHSLEETDMKKKQEAFAAFVLENQPDIIALQEVNQIMTAPVLPDPEGYVPAQDAVPLKSGNHALAVSRLLEAGNLAYAWSWLPAKVGYGKYDEGLALFSRKPILETASLLVSNTDDYSNYRTRRLLGIRTEDGWFFTVHMSWWSDPEEPFACQWQKLLTELPEDVPVYLMGDFNGDAQVKGETWDLVAASGFTDLFMAARTKDEGWTVQGVIDGWRDQESVPARRIDQIWMRQAVPVRSSRVVFNGRMEPVISDHFGVLAETEQN